MVEQFDHQLRSMLETVSTVFQAKKVDEEKIILAKCTRTREQRLLNAYEQTLSVITMN